MIERDSRKILRLLMAQGFKVLSIRGSHHKLGKDGRVVIVPHPKRDLPLGTARSIYRQAGLPESERGE